MNTPTACPDHALLLQFRSRELDAQTTRTIQRHLDTCAICRAWCQEIEQAEAAVHAALAATPLPLVAPAATPECLSPEVVVGYVHRKLPPTDMTRRNRHLHTCNACMQEVIEAFAESRVASASQSPVPVALKNKVRALWKEPEEKKLSRLVIQMAQQGLRLLDTHLVAPLRDVQPVLIPAPASRSGRLRSDPRRSDGIPPTLNLKIDAGHTAIEVSAVQEGDGIALRMTLRDAAQATLANQRVFLRQRGRAVFSDKTDAQGTLRIPRLDPGVYEVSCPKIAVTFHLELRS